MNIHTADLCDENQDKKIQVLSPNFKNYGGLKRFYGQIETIKLDKSNWRLLEMLRDENGELRKRVPAGYYSKPDNIRKELIRIKPKSLSDWQKKNDNSYVWAWKLGIQRELFNEYLIKSKITQGN